MATSTKRFRGVRICSRNGKPKGVFFGEEQRHKGCAEFEEVEELRRQTLDAHRNDLTKVKSQASADVWLPEEFNNFYLHNDDGSAGPSTSCAPLPGDAATAKQIQQEALVVAGEVAPQLELDERDEHMARE